MKTYLTITALALFCIKNNVNASQVTSDLEYTGADSFLENTLPLTQEATPPLNAGRSGIKR